MAEGKLDEIERLSDGDLLGRVLRLADQEREATVDLVAHLGELDARRLYLAEGFSSLFAYCTGELHLAEYAAYNRIEAARVCRRFPELLDRLADGSLTLATLRVLGPHLRPDNLEEVVGRARGMSKRGVEALVAQLSPRPDVPSSVRKLPSPKSLPRGLPLGSVPKQPHRLLQILLPNRPRRRGALAPRIRSPRSTARCRDLAPRSRLIPRVSSMLQARRLRRPLLAMARRGSFRLHLPPRLGT
jgi:hypothetical protein